MDDEATSDEKVSPSESLRLRQRSEEKELEDRIQAERKAVPAKERKRRRELISRCDKLRDELSKRHAAERIALSSSVDQSDAPPDHASHSRTENGIDDVSERIASIQIGEASSPSELSSVDALSLRQRNEEKELRDRLQAELKSIPAKERKRLQAFNSRSDKTLKELSRQHNRERIALERAVIQCATASAAAFESSDDRQSSEQCSADTDSITDAGKTPADEQQQAPTSKKPRDKAPKLTKAQRRRDKKEKEQAERSARTEAMTKAVKKQWEKHPRATERKILFELLQQRDLQLYTVESDGHCLYSAISHQLSLRDMFCSVSGLRNRAADFLLDNDAEFRPFMCNDAGDALSASEFQHYVDSIRTTNEWGGNLELRALSHVFRTPIVVLQACPGAPEIVVGQEYRTEAKPLVITYHRNEMRFGEHYNSTVSRNAA